MKVLFTGFEPFGNETRNPSWEAVQLLPGKLDGTEIVKLQLPVVYDSCAQKLFAAIEKEKPDAVICVGQAGGRSSISVELIALNSKDSISPDKAGNCYSGEHIVEGGPVAYETTLPARAMVKAMKSAGVPAAVSYCAGTYVCNNVMYHLLHYAAHQEAAIKAGFIHIPFDEVQAVEHGGNAAFMPLSMVTVGLENAVLTLKEN